MAALDRTKLPPRLLPVCYFALAHVALLLAFAAVAADPRAAAGFFYHARMLAIVHLVTLGWITASILGSLYLVAPIALRTHLPARGLDYTAFAFVTVGIAGMIAHFWIAEYGGVAWSAATAVAGILCAGVRVLAAIRRSPIAWSIKAHVGLAFLNIAAAATMGVLIGFSKVHPFLPGYVLANVFAHAHLAAIGWASMMVVGVGYRLLPMVLPAEMTDGASTWASAVLIETGVLGLFVALVRRSGMTAAWALLIVAGLAAFVAHVVRMLRHPRPRPPAIATPDPAVLHAGAALLSLVVAAGLGLWLSLAPVSERSLRVAMAYGVLGLVGFLSQMIVAMGGRLLPIFAWYWAFANAPAGAPVPSPHQMPWRPAQLIVFALWAFGVPALAAGLALEALFYVRAAAWSLLAATVLDTAQVAWILSFAWRRSGTLST